MAVVTHLGWPWVVSGWVLVAPLTCWAFFTVVLPRRKS